MPVRAAVKHRVDAWVLAVEAAKLEDKQSGMHGEARSGKHSGKLFRPVSKAGKITGDSIQEEKGIWEMVDTAGNRRRFLPNHLLALGWTRSGASD